MFRFSLIILLLSSTVLASALGESSIGKQLLTKPLMYENPTGAIAGDKDKRQDAQGQHIWVVVSDRDNNLTYTASDGKVSYKSLKFGDAFYVTEDKGNYIHILQFDNSPPSSLYSQNKKSEYILTKNLVDFGWVPKEKMLLWDKCLVDDNSKFSIKALTIASPEAFAKLGEYTTGVNLKLFNDPAVESTPPNKNEVRIFNFLYIYKEDKVHNTCLIGKKVQFFKQDAPFVKKFILGWVSQAMIKKWKDRMTLQRNADADAIAERKEKDIKITITKTEGGAKQLKLMGK